MKRKWSLLVLAVLVSSGYAQETAPPWVNGPTAIHDEVYGQAPVMSAEGDGESGFLTGDRAFPRFIGFVSNPILSIDPRALTQLWPVFVDTASSKFGPVPAGDIQLYGVGISVALSERFEVGLNNGGYVYSHLATVRQGLLNLGGFAQYTLIRDVPNQFLLSTGLQVEAPTGEASVGQGHGPAYLTPYMTFGKEFGDFHVLATTGYRFPTGPGTATNDIYYANLHFDVRTFCWLYPLVEFNGAWPSKTLDLSTTDFTGVFGIDQHTFAGGIVTLAPGFNTILVPDRLEFGAVYQTDIYSEHHYHFNEVLLKMILRY
jgi:hypothetical protein